MRINTVRFRNLNSLAGEWLIDFTDARYVESGIFAITGPTGAGKSTILDAICLALFGRTPRLDRGVTAGGNEIMTKGTGECMAEVEFDTSAGVRYRATWMQHRARGAANGNLQQPTHQVVNLTNDEILTEKKRATDEKIAEITGLDFGRFTKSVMLAQNAFAEFLKMESGSRAELLEKITGGEIYADISVAVFRRHAAEAAALKDRQTAVDSIRLLTDQEIADLMNGVAVADAAARDASARTTQSGDALRWLESMESLVAEGERLAVDRTKLDTDVEGFRPDAVRLELAESAARIAGEWQAVRNAREQILELEKRAFDFRGRLTGLQAAELNADQAARDADAAAGAAAEQVVANDPIIRQARELDGEIRTVARQLGETRADADKRSAVLDDLNVRLAGARAKVSETGDRLLAVVGQMEQNAVDATLESELGGVRLKIGALQDARTAVADLGRTLEGATARLDGIIREIDGLQVRQAELKKDESDAERELTALQAARDESLRGHDVPWWNAERDRLAALANNLARAVQAAAARGQATDELTRLAEADETAAKSIQDLETLFVEHQKSSDILEELHKQQIDTRTLQATVKDLDAHRAALRDGVECPLCGSKNHPYAAGNVPADDEIDNKIAETRRRLDAERAAMAEMDRAIAGLRAGIEANQGARDRVVAALDQYVEILTEMSAQCGFNAADDDLPTVLAGMTDRTGANLADAAAVIKSVVAADAGIALASRRHQGCRDGRIQVDHDIQTTVVRRKAATDDIARLRADIGLAETRKGELTAQVATLAATWGIVPERLDRPDTVLQELEGRRQAWAALQTTRTTLEKDIQSLRASEEGLAGNIARDARDLDDVRKRLETFTAALDGLRERRRTVLAEPDVDAFEARLSAAAGAAVQARDSARQALSTVRADLKSQNDQIAENTRATAVARDALNRAEAVFSAALSRRGFADQAAFVAAMLADDEIECLAARRSELEKRSVELDTRTTENANRLTAERERAVTDLDRATVLERLNQAETDLAKANQQLGELRARLEMDRIERERAGEQLEQMAAMQEQVARWKHLNDLIGSAEGKNFRQFAQGITFEHLVRNANEHLKVLSDRYRLRMAPITRDGNASLDLDVVDEWQGGDARTVKNLSGGETFIVSLALALGLASLASRRIRIDSFFLDEGFGTLDQDALNAAMDALGELRRDGKLIGVISHVEALKERIDTRIQVSRERGGRSTLSGPGVSRVRPDTAGA